MAWIPVHQSLVTHRKTLHAASLLGIPPVALVGHVICLWLWSVDNARDGLVGHLPPVVVAQAAQWSGPPEAFYTALVEAAFITDGALHNWELYAGKYIALRAKNLHRMKIERAAHVQRTHDARVTVRGEERRVEKSRVEETASKDAVKKRRSSPVLRLLQPSELLKLFSEDERLAMAKRFPGVDLEWEAGKCVEWHNAHNGSRNWKLALKNWLERVKEGNDDRSPRQQPASALSKY